MKIIMGKYRYPLFIFFIPFLSSCAVFTSNVLIDSTSPEKPTWITKIPKDDEEYFYFRGMETEAEKKEDGIANGRNQAIRQIIELLGEKGFIKYDYIRKKDDVTIEDELRMKGYGIVRGAIEKEVYWEKRKKGHDVYILVAYPKKEYMLEQERNKELQKIIGSAKQKFISANSLLIEGENLIKPSPNEARRKLNESKEFASAAKAEIIDYEECNELKSEIDKLLADITTSIEKIYEERGYHKNADKIGVIIKEADNNFRRNTAAENIITEELKKGGYIVVDLGSDDLEEVKSNQTIDVLLVGRINAEYRGNTVTDPTSGREIPFLHSYTISIECKCKDIYNDSILFAETVNDIDGFGQQRRSAYTDAVNKAIEKIKPLVISDIAEIIK